MTKLQESLYWRLWWAAAVAQGWNRLPTAQISVKRHAAHANALGRDKTHKDFTNAECDKVFRLFKVLAAPDDISKRVDLDAHLHSNKGERDRLIFRIQQCGSQDYIEKIMREKFDTARLADLDLKQLDHLRITLIERKRARARREEIDALTPNPS